MRYGNPRPGLKHQYRPKIVHIGEGWPSDVQIPQGAKKTVTVVMVSMVLRV
jgi:hypothetical protein